MAVSIFRGDPKNPQPGDYEVTFEGRVLGLREMNGYDDSDFYARVWDDEAGKPKEVEYATTRGWTYKNSASVDADDETLAKYAEYLTEQKVAAAMRAEREREGYVEKGKTVTLTRRVRSKNHGTFNEGEQGVVFWVGADKYAPHWKRNAERAGVDFGDDRKHFFATDDLEVVVDETKLRTAAEIREGARHSAQAEVEQIRAYRDRNKQKVAV